MNAFSQRSRAFFVQRCSLRGSSSSNSVRSLIIVLSRLVVLNEIGGVVDRPAVAALKLLEAANLLLDPAIA